MHSFKKCIVIPFLKKSNNEVAMWKINSAIASGDGLCNGNTAVSKADIESTIVHDVVIETNNDVKNKIYINDELFLAVTDELQTPLNIIYSAAQLMELHLENNFEEADKEKVNKSINSIKQNCFRLIKLIKNLTDLLKIEANQFDLNLSCLNIVEVVENIVQNVSDKINERQLNILFDTDIEEKMVLCDAEKIERVVLSMLANAVKYSNPGEIIYVNVISKENVVEIEATYECREIDKQYLSNALNWVQLDKLIKRCPEIDDIELLLSKSIIELHGGKQIGRAHV